MTDYNPLPRTGVCPAVRRGDILVFARYGVVGVVQNGLFYGLALGMLWLNFKAWQALAILYPVAVTISFLVNRSWSFGNRQSSRQQFRNYAFVYVVAYPLTIAFTWIQEYWGIASWLASLITMLVSALIIFLALNYWVFGKSEMDERPA